MSFGKIAGVRRAPGRPTGTAVEELLAMNAGCVGASTGYMLAARGHWTELVSAAAEVSDAVAELSALSAAELPGLVSFLREPHEIPIRRLTVHGPALGWRAAPTVLAEQLAALPPSVVGVVMHPETLGEVHPFRAVGGRLLLENMDTRKQDARTVEELLPYFEALPEARFCLDVAHAWLHDPTLHLAHDLLDAFGDRLAEVHLSSIRSDGRHVPLEEQDAAAFRAVLERCVGVPWILEAPLPADAFRAARTPGSSARAPG